MKTSLISNCEEEALMNFSLFGDMKRNSTKKN